MRYSFLLIASLLPATLFAQSSTVTEGYDFLAKQCGDLQCIQDNLDMIDSQITSLVTKRLSFVKHGAELKNSNVLAPKAPGYGNASERAGNQAQQLGSSSSAVGPVFEAIQKQSDEYEKQYLTPPTDKPKK